jgi:hypothetical protein
VCARLTVRHACSATRQRSARAVNCRPGCLPCLPCLPCPPCLPCSAPADQNLDAARPTDYDCRCFFLHRPRLELYRRIDGRVEEMVAGGLLKVSK